jgi:serine/threonine-protein kinase
MEAPPPQDPPDPRIGSVLQGRYRINAKLAAGAMGVVYKGERVQLGRPVAVKFLHPWIAAHQAFLTRFDNEARAMSRLQHPHCVSVIDFGVEGSPYLVMDFATGRTLRQVLEGGRIEPTRVLRLARQLLAGVGHAHAQGIVHRDLKPENLVLADEAGLGEHLRILDFGLAKLRDGPAMTTGLAVGTPSYMSPEQTGAEGAIDARTDLYAVGVVLFELLTGQKPFVSDNVGQLLLMHRETPPPLLRATAPDAGFSAELEAVVTKALSKFADDRYQSAAELVAALEATPEGRGVERPSAARAVAAPPSGAPGRAVAADATIVESPSAIERIVNGQVGGPAAVPRDRKRVWLGVGAGAVAVIALLVGAATRPPRGQTGGSGAVAERPASHVAPAGGDARLEEARVLVARGEWERAIALLETLRAERPDAAEPAYLLATIQLDHRRFSDGLAAAQLAARKDPTLKSDPDLIKGVIQALASDTSYERAQAFLRGSGAAATPFIKEAARRDPNAKVRDRASELLEGGGRGSSWSSRSSSGGGSIFRR